MATRIVSTAVPSVEPTHPRTKSSQVGLSGEIAAYLNVLLDAPRILANGNLKVTP
jgi:hypothetical protein